MKHFAESTAKAKERVEAKGLLQQLQQFNFVFMLHLLDSVLPLLSGASKYMQSKSADTAHTMALVESTVAALQSLRNGEAYDKLFQAVSDFCVSNGVTVPKNRQMLASESRTKHPPQRLADFVVLSKITQNQAESVAGESLPALRREMFEIIDRFSNELEKRFVANKIELVACSAASPSSCNFLVFEAIKPMAELFSYLPLDEGNLFSQLCVVREMLKRSDKATMQSAE